MDTKNLHLVVLSPERTLFDGPVESVELPGEQGCFEVLVNHAPIISSLCKGNVTYETIESGSRIRQTISIQRGFVEVKDNLVSACVEP